MIQIGNIKLPDRPLFLAPMEDITDPSFRYLCKYFGADMMYTEFISSDGLIRNGRKSLKKLELNKYERPIGIQIYGNQVETMTKAAIIANDAKPELIDINFGCPVKKITIRGAGAGLLKNIPLMVEITDAVVKNTSLPITVKTRVGWDEENINIATIAEQLQDVGIKAITIHGRTRNQLYKGKADWAIIGDVKNNPRIKIPVIGNGDIDSPEQVKEYFTRYGVDGIMIGRSAIGRPWIFRDIKHYLNNGEILKPPTVMQKVEWVKLHLQKTIEWKGERIGILEMRRHLSNYFKGLSDFKEARLKLVTLVNSSEIYHLLDEIGEKYGELRLPSYPFWPEKKVDH